MRRKINRGVGVRQPLTAWQRVGYFLTALIVGLACAGCLNDVTRDATSQGVGTGTVRHEIAPAAQIDPFLLPPCGGEWGMSDTYPCAWVSARDGEVTGTETVPVIVYGLDCGRVDGPAGTVCYTEPDAYDGP